MVILQCLHTRKTQRVHVKAETCSEVLKLLHHGYRFAFILNTRTHVKHVKYWQLTRKWTYQLIRIEGK